MQFKCVTSLFYRHIKKGLVFFLCVYVATAVQEDPFELDSSLLLSSGRHGIVVRGSTLYNHETPLLGDLADLLYSGIVEIVLLKI